MYTHAIFPVIPDDIRAAEKKTKIDVPTVHAQIEGFQETLREAGISIMEIETAEGKNNNLLYLNDLAIVIGQTALIGRTVKVKETPEQLVRILKQLVWKVDICPAKTYGGDKIILDAQDVLFTGKEILVSTRKNGTNLEGAVVLSRTFSSHHIVVLPFNKLQPIRHYISVAIPGEVLTIGNSKEAEEVKQIMRSKTTYTYNVITTDDSTAAACLNFNNRVVFRQDRPEPKFSKLREDGLELWALDVSEISKITSPFTRFCLLVNDGSSANQKQA
ncbi:unnamed protein product, partial [Mesorhabditis spiculigera]